MKTLKCINREKRMEARAQAEVVRVRNGWRDGENAFRPFIRALCFLTVSPAPPPASHTFCSRMNEPSTNVEASPEKLCALPSSKRQTKKFKWTEKRLLNIRAASRERGKEEANDRTKRESFLNGLFNGEYENGSSFNLPSNERNVNGEISWNFYNHSSSVHT